MMLSAGQLLATSPPTGSRRVSRASPRQEGWAAPGSTSSTSPGETSRSRAAFFVEPATRTGGSPGGPVLELVARRQPSGTAFAAETRKALAALGLRSRVRFLAFGPFIRACSRGPRVAACLGYRWQRDLDDAASVLPPLFGAEGLHAGTNVSRLSDPTLQGLMKEAETTTGEADRAARWATADRQATELAPGVPIVFNRDPNLRSADVKGVLDRELGTWDLSFTSLRVP